VARAAAPDAVVAVTAGSLAGRDAPDGVELVPPAASLRDELLAADLVVTAAGQTSLEAAATGAPAVVVPMAPNQRPNAAALSAAGAAVVGDPREAISELVADAGRRAALARAAQAVVDGQGARRIAAALT
jgi:spore coat polysaccharide biosynthesis predicted glycosyltransferase SpsG